MLKLESVALELLEYKVAEFRATRQVRGGVGAMWELLGHLSQQSTSLSTDERERLAAVSQSLKLITDAPQGTAAPAGDIETLVFGGESDVELVEGDEGGSAVAPSSPEVRDEQAVLQRLARRVWWEQVDEFVMRVAASWRAERERQTARVMYGTLQNLQRNSVKKTFAQDVNLRGFQVLEPIPAFNDPLISLSDLDALGEIVRDLINTVMTLGKPNGDYADVEVRESEALSYLRKAALAVAQDPYAGKVSLVEHKGASSKQLRLAIQEVARERLPEGQRGAHRRELEKRLAETQALERNQRQLFQRDVTQFTDLVHAFFDRLADYLPTTVGGRAGGPQLEGGVLFAVNPALRWDAVPPGATALTVRLMGPVRFDMVGKEIAVMGSGPSRSLFIDELEVPLKEFMVLDLGRSRLSVFNEGDYLHLRYRDEERSLAGLLAEALVVVFVLTNPLRDDLLTVLKVLAGSVQGEPQDLVSRAVARANQVSARAPNRRQAVEGLLRGAARAAEVALDDNAVLGLVQHFVDAMTVGPSDLTQVLESFPGAETNIYQLTGEPLTVDVGGQKVTVRQYRGRSKDAQESLVAMLPGQVLGSFTDYLISAVNKGTLTLVRGDQELAVLFVPGLGADTSVN